MSDIVVAIYCLVYNHEPYLRDCLDGFVMQKTNFRFVAIVHDDVSRDKSVAIIQEYAEKYPDIIHPIFEKENLYSKNDGSIDRVMNAAIDATGAKYIALCEGDDYWTDPLKLQKQVDYMESHPDCGLCVTDFCIQNDLDKERISKSAFLENNHFKPTTFEEHLMNAGYIAPMTWLYRASVFECFKYDHVGASDSTFTMALDFFAISKVAYLPDVTAVYRIHAGSEANPNTTEKKFAYINGIFKTQLAYAKKYKCDDKLIDNIKFQKYTTIIPLALECNNQAFIDNALEYYNSKGLVMKWFVDSCNEYVDYKKRFLQIRSSKAYRLGRILLKPFKWLGKK